MATKFYVCAHCGNVVEKVVDKGVPLQCCGEAMAELVPGSVDAAVEKHVPVIEVNGSEVKVSVGSVAHPMTEEHLISWIWLETEQGGQRKVLPANAAPVADFVLAGGDKAVAAYAFCNLHGLWKAEV